MRLFFISFSSIFVLGILSLLTWGVFFSSNPNEIPSALIGRSASNFVVTSFKGEKIELSKLKGKAVILNFWASWCIECRKEAKVLEAANKLMKDKGLIVIGIAINDTLEDARRFAQKYGKTYVLALDDTLGNISLDYGVTAVPESFFIDKTGIITQKITGQIRQEEIFKFAQHENIF